MMRAEEKTERLGKRTQTQTRLRQSPFIRSWFHQDGTAAEQWPVFFALQALFPLFPSVNKSTVVQRSVQISEDQWFVLLWSLRSFVFKNFEESGSCLQPAAGSLKPEAYSNIMKKSEIENMPPALSAEEIRLKLGLLAEVLSENKYDAVVFSSEGSMRWLTGLKHQLGDIAPSAPSPVQALVHGTDSGRAKIIFVSKPFEMPRLKDEIPRIFNLLPEVQYGFAEQMLPLTERTLTADDADYPAVMDRVVRPLPGGTDGDSYEKLQWLSRTSMRVLGETARQFKEGMDGLTVRGMVLNNLARHGIDANLVLIALAGQETHLHPIASAQYRIQKGWWIKLVIGARYAEHIVSQTLMVKPGGKISERETEVYHALQQAALEVADLYREGAPESDIYQGMIDRFEQVEKESGLKGFAKSATLHHPGGGTSPLGNRDRMIDPSGTRVCEPWTQFAINPVDALLGLKVELQGVIQPDGAPPLILDLHSEAPDIPFRKMISRGGTEAVLPELFIV
jgi:hypothetical protein